MAFVSAEVYEGEGTATATPRGDGTGSWDIVATPAAGWAFDHWVMWYQWEGYSEYRPDYANPTEVSDSISDQLNGIVCRAYFYNATPLFHTVTVVADPTNGGTVSGSGSYEAGTSCTITATPKTGWTFTGWTSSKGGSDSDASHTFTVEGDVTWTAHFTQTTYTVAVVASPANGGTMHGGGAYTKDSSCSIYALTNTGWRFDRWTSSGGETSYDPQHTFTVGGDVTWTAHFTQIEYTVTVVANPANGGTVSGEGTFHYNDNIEITATPSSGKFFIRWEASDGSTADKASHWFRVTGNVTWTAIFKEGWPIKVKIVRGAKLGYFVTPDGWWDNTDPGHSRPLEVNEIENTQTSYYAVIAAKRFEPYSRVDNVFRIYLNDASKCEIALVRVIKGYQPGDYVQVPGSIFDVAYAVRSYGVRHSLAFNGADVEIYLRYKSTGELLHGSSGALLHGKNGDLLYL